MGRVCHHASAVALPSLYHSTVGRSVRRGVSVRRARSTAPAHTPVYPGETAGGQHIQEESNSKFRVFMLIKNECETAYFF